MIPELLYHKTRYSNISGILDEGIVPQKPDEWKYLIPMRHRSKNLVWLKENYQDGDIIIHTKILDKRRLRKLNIRDKKVKWWIYVGRIPQEAITL